MIDHAATTVAPLRDSIRIARSGHATGGSTRRTKRDRPLRVGRLDTRPRLAVGRPLGGRIDVKA